MTKSMTLFAPTHPEAKAPKREYVEDAGFDLFAVDYAFIKRGAVTIVNTHIQTAIPKGHVGLICPRSGLAAQYGVTVVNSPGIIDSGYRGEIKVILTSLGVSHEFFPGNKVAQLLIVPINVASKLVPYIEDETSRGEGGLGSTGA